MKELSHGHKAAYATLLYVVIVIIVLFASNHYAGALDLADTHINRTHAFPRLPGTTCEQIGGVNKLALFVKDMDTGLRAVGCSDGANPTATFALHHEGVAKTSAEIDRAVWDEILGNPLATAHRPRELGYDIRWLKDDKTVQQMAKPGGSFSFYIFEWWSPTAVAVVVLVWGLLIYLARHSALLRDAGTKDAALEARTFSLAKTQLAWWFAIIFAAFVFLWLVTGELPTLSGQALALLGISSATTMASVGISADRTPAHGESGVFFRDLLSDANGITIQRFQMLVMTIALGLMFLIHVATHLTMPEFDASLLTVLGISAGTYVGLKIPEDQGGAGKPPTGDAVDTTDGAKSAYSATS
ncbi:MAG: hypothetical protein ABI460_11655 [Caldimonas sp.]